MTHRRLDLGQRSETVRRANLSSIVRVLHVDGPQSRSDLVARTGLTRSAIRALVGELTAAGLATEDPGVANGRPGRPSPLVRLVPESAVGLAFSVLVDSLSVAVVGLGGTVLAEAREDRPRVHTAPEEVVGDLMDLLGQLPGGPPPTDRIVAVGVGVAGVVRRLDGLVEMAPNLGWTRVPLAALLRDRLGLDVPIAIGNEADMGALAEARRGAAVGIGDMIYIHGEVGVGAGILVGGRPLAGAAGYAGELGHFPIFANGAPCRCGSHGCWETEIGAEVLLARAKRSPDGGREGMDELIADADGGDPAVLRAIETTASLLGVGLAGFVNTFNPRLIVLGGLFGRLYAHARDATIAAIEARALPAPRAMVRVVPAALGDDAPLLGAGELALEGILADPADWLATREPAAQLATA